MMVWLVYPPTTIVTELFGIQEAESFLIADAHRDDGKRFVVRADDKLTAFLELARIISIHLLTKDVEHP